MRNSTSPPESIKHAVDATSSVSNNGWNMFRITPRGIPAPERHIFYIHGGAFVHHMLEGHWKALSKMVVASGAAATIPAYPLGAEGTAKRVPGEMTQLVEEFIRDVGSNNAFLMGDSAGGNIALTATTLLRDRGVPLPARTIVISPWLDLEFKGNAAGAPGAKFERLQRDAEIWRADLEFSDPLVSPLNAALHDLGKVAIFCGTEDFVSPGCWQFGEAAAGQPGTDLEFYESPGARHSHVLSDNPAGTGAQAIIIDMIQGSSGA